MGKSSVLECSDLCEEICPSKYLHGTLYKLKVLIFHDTKVLVPCKMLVCIEWDLKQQNLSTCKFSILILPLGQISFLIYFPYFYVPISNPLTSPYFLLFLVGGFSVPLVVTEDLMNTIHISV